MSGNATLRKHVARHYTAKLGCLAEGVSVRLDLVRGLTSCVNKPMMPHIRVGTAPYLQDQMVFMGMESSARKAWHRVKRKRASAAALPCLLTASRMWHCSRRVLRTQGAP